MATSSNNAGTAPGFLSKSGTLRLVYYNVVLMILMGAGLYYVITSAASVQAGHEAEARKKETFARPTAPVAPSNISEAPVAAQSDTDDSASTMASEVADSGAMPSSENESVPEIAAATETPFTDPRMIAYVLFAITMAGGLGGTLCNLRGIFEFTRDNQGMFPSYLELGFYLRPVSGVLCGLFTFFVSTFFAGALSQGDGSGWHTLEGMFPYIGIAFIAGFASQEFMERLKDTAKTLFGGGSATAAAPEPEPEPEPVAEPESGNRESIHIGPESGGRESVSRTPETPPAKKPAPAPRRSVPPQKMAD